MGKNQNSQAVISIVVSLFVLFLGFRSFRPILMLQTSNFDFMNMNPMIIFFILWIAIVGFTIIRSILRLLGKNPSHNSNYENMNGYYEDEDAIYQSNVNNKKRLEELQHLYDSGLITRKEYNEKRQSIINQL